MDFLPHQKSKIDKSLTFIADKSLNIVSSKQVSKMMYCTLGNPNDCFFFSAGTS